MATAFAPRPAATMTARVVVMMTPEEKRALEVRSREFDFSPSEFVRQATQKFDPSFDDKIFETIAIEIESNNVAMRAQLTGLAERIDATIAAMDELRAGK